MPDRNVGFVAAPDGWSPELPNPFSPDGSYHPGWSCFEIVDGLDSNFKHGKNANGLFHMRFGPNVERLEARLAAFLRYEPLHGRRVIMACPANIDIGVLVTRAATDHPSGGHLSREELRWLVHSTDMDAWNGVRECGELQSLAALRRQGRQIVPLGMVELKEPDDYAEYVMFGLPGQMGPENVVASRARGEIYTQENEPYTPGVRLYFDGYAIMDNGLAVYDGVHLLKVHNHLPLDYYLVAAVTTADVDPGGRITEWTPRTFTEAADAYFKSQVAV